MRPPTRLVPCAALIGLLITVTPPVFAAAPSDTDLLCGFTSVTDPNPEAPENQQTSTIDGGPVAQNGVITCTIKVGANKFHSSPVGNGARAQAEGTNGVTVLSPTLVSYTAEPLENVYLCDQFTDSDGNVWVYDGVDGAWEANNATAECSLAISASTEDPVIGGVRNYVSGRIHIEGYGNESWWWTGPNGSEPYTLGLCTGTGDRVTCFPEGHQPATKWACANLDVVVWLDGFSTGLLTGTSACTAAASASVGPSPGARSSEVYPGGSSPFTCSADKGLIVGRWEVTCTVYGRLSAAQVVGGSPGGGF